MSLHLGVLSRPANFHAEKWSSALARAGARVTLFTLDAPTPVVGVEVVSLPTAVRWGGRYRYPAYALSAGALRRALQHHGVHVLHPLHLTPFGTWAVQAGLRPVVAAAMGADVLEYPRHRPLADFARTWRERELQHSPLQLARAWAMNRFYRQQVARVIRRADLLTGDNQPLVDAMITHFGAPPARTRLLRWGLEPERFAPARGGPERGALEARVRQQFGIAPHRRVLLSPRGANALYQADIVLEAFERLLTQHSALLEGHHLLMLGAGYDVSASVAERAAALAQRHPNFSFVPEQLPRQLIYDLWALTDVFVSAPVYDGYSAAVAEGRFAGAIPVVNAIAGNLEILTHAQNAWFVHPFAPQLLTEALVEVVQRRAELQPRFAQLNREWVAQHSLLQPNAARLLTWADALWRGLPLPD